MNFKLEPRQFETSEFIDENNIMAYQYKQIIDCLSSMVSSDFDKYQYEKENLVLIDGYRGSGKTTALLSLRNYVKSSDEFKTVYPLYDIIDPSMFNNNSSLLQLVISAMFNDVKSKLNQYNEDSIKLLGDFEKVTRLLNYDSSFLKDSADYVAELDTYSDYYDLKKIISSLVKSFLKIKSTNSIKYTDICIFIDDIDLNIEYSYKMIEQIRKYLKQSNILIVIASMRENIKYSFSKTLVPQFGPIIEMANKYEKEEKSFTTQHVLSEVDKYLYKLFPSKNIIRIPSLQELYFEFKEDGSNILSSKFNLIENTRYGITISNPMIELCLSKWLNKTELREYIQDYLLINESHKIFITEKHVHITYNLYKFIDSYFFKFDKLPIEYERGNILISINEIEERISSILDNFDNYNASDEIYLELYFYVSWLKKKNENFDLFKLEDMDENIVGSEQKNTSNLLFLFSCLGQKYYLTDIYVLDECSIVDLLSLAHKITKTKKKKINKKNFLKGIRDAELVETDSSSNIYEILKKHDIKDIRFENLDDELRLLDFEISKAMDSNSYDTINKLNTKIRKTKFKDIINEEALIDINNELKKYRKTTTDEKPDYKRYNNKYSKLLKRLLNL